MKAEQLLNGTWNYRVGKGAFSTIEIPFSVRPVGHSECVRRFDLDETAPRTFLRFDGINYEAVVTLNGKTLGTMLPYCTYIYDVTDTVMTKDNLLSVSLEDMSPVFGPSEGWENYGGIPRDVRLLYRETSYITDVIFDAVLENNYTAATMKVTVNGKGNERDQCLIRLYDGRRLVSRHVQRLDETKPVTLPSIIPWSPEDPHLYRLTTTLLHEGKPVDTDTRYVGFREFRTDKRRFLFNGKPTFLTGVCYHEFYGESGHLVDPAQTERDFRMIKKMGCNYVRLVHYPHAQTTIDIADRVGLFVSEEPGLWWSDTSRPENYNGSIEVLRRTIRRDRTHPSIIFWLCFNECKFTKKYLIDSAKACREADPTRLVSGANCMDLEDTLTYFKLCDFDFYTMHPYSETPQRMLDSIKALSDKPLMFTEWGGYYVTDNPQLFTDFVDTITAAWRNPDDGNVLTGAAYWCFADIYEWNRRRPACKDGILREGLVDPWRKPSSVFQSFVDGFARLNERVSEEEKFGAELLAQPISDTLALPEADEAAFDALMTASRQPVMRFVHDTKRLRKLEVGPRLPEDQYGLSAVPKVICEGHGLTVPVAKQGNSITMICAGGPFCYPISGTYGEPAAVMTVRYEDGGETVLPLRSGVEIATFFEIYGPSRIRPVAESAVPYLRFHYDSNHEDYLLQRIDLPIDGARKVREIVFTDGGVGSHFLIYALALS